MITTTHKLQCDVHVNTVPFFYQIFRGHWAIPRIRKNITRYKIYIFHRGMAPFINLNGQNLGTPTEWNLPGHAEWYNMDSVTDYPENTFDYLIYKKHRPIFIYPTSGVRHSSGPTVQVPEASEGEYNNMLFISLKHRNSDYCSTNTGKTVYPSSFPLETDSDGVAISYCTAAGIDHPFSNTHNRHPGAPQSLYRYDTFEGSTNKFDIDDLFFGVISNHRIVPGEGASNFPDANVGILDVELRNIHGESVPHGWDNHTYIARGGFRGIF